MWDLNELIVGNKHWKLHSAVAINDEGQIVVVGERRQEGLQRTCLLIPIGKSDR